jgi:hypothetical protein
MIIFGFSAKGSTREKSMKQIGTMFFIVVCVASISFSQPKLSIDKPEIDLGIIYSGMKKQGKIVLSNIGNDTLRIYSVQPSCGCTTVKQPKSILLPFESDVVEVEFNSSGYRSGKIEKHINITTNDASSEIVSVKLVSVVKEELESTSHTSNLWFGNISLGKDSMQETSLRNTSDHIIKIKSFTTSSPSVNIKIEKKILHPNDTVNIQIAIKPEKIGFGNDYFSIETDSKNQPFVEIRVSYMCKEK